MSTESTKIGIGTLGDIPWGTHFCGFYETKEDLLDILVPYLKTGLENSEFCMWTVFPPPGKEETIGALRRAIPNVDQRLAAGDIEVLEHKEWYLKGGTFDSQRVIDGWLEKLTRALARGYAGMRTGGNRKWLTQEDWENFSVYDEKLNKFIAHQRMIVLCSYPLGLVRAAELFDLARMARAHEFAIAKRRGKWEVVESPETRQAWHQMKRLNEELERRVVKQTKQLEATNEKLRAEIADRKNRERELECIGRALRLVSHSNAMLVHLTDETTALSEICRIAVEIGGYKMAWVGFAEQDERKTVRPVAHAGFEAGYLESVTITWGDEPYGRGPAGTAIRTGQPCVARNIPEDPAHAPWHNEVIQLGYLSSIALPLRSVGRTFGVLSIFAAEADAFDDGETKVLLELAKDLAFGLTILRTRAEHDRTEEELRASEAKFRALSENAPVAIFIYQGNRYRYVNPAEEIYTGYSRQELLEMNLWDVAHPDFRGMVREDGLMRQRGESVPSRYEVKIVTKTGEERWVDFSDGKFELDGKPAIIGMSLDITERKRMEQALRTTTEQLRALTVKLESVREEEGRRIGRELHDEIGSAVTSLKWDLEGLDKLCSEAGGQVDCSTLRERIKGMVELVDTTSSTVQKISSELRPAILDDLGLIPAIEWQAQELAARTGIVCQFDSSVESIDMDREKATAVFRIIQEALTNILRHSQATRANIILEKENHELIVEVRDNGRGITESEKTKPSSLGLIGMQERAHLINGKIEITGIPGKGTVLTVRVPLFNQGSG